MTEPLRFLVVDDDRAHADLVVEFIRATGAWPGAELAVAVTYDQAVEMLCGARVDLALVDYRLGAQDGLTLLREVRGRGVETPVIVLTGHGAEQTAVEAMKAGAADYLVKTQLSIEVVERTVRYALALRAQQEQRRHAEAALRASEERFRALVEHSSDTLVLLDATGRVVYASPSIGRHLGWKVGDMVGRSIFEFVHPDDRGLVSARIADLLRHPHRAVTAEIRLRHTDNSWRVMEGLGVNHLDDPSVRAVVFNARDVTERRRLEDQLRMSQKMEAVGQLAGGVAHDFNNLLTAILGYCNLLLEDVPADSPLRPDLAEIRSAGERAAELTRQLLAFSRRQILNPQIVDITDLAGKVEKLLRSALHEDIELVISLAPEVPPVRIDPISFEQILLNLAVNGRDAMPGGGRLTIETAAAEIDEAFARAHIPMTTGSYALLTIRDTGRGMDESIRARIFEPFFTTKQQGKGSGLGLASVYGIVKQSGGYIWVDSEPGRGTTFAIYLPAVEAEREAPPADDGPSNAADRGWETVLLVEDEDAVRALAREVLRRHGYAVLEARHGLDALRVAERHGDDIHLMVTDVVMPHMGGRDLAERLSALRPNMKILFMSGYEDRAELHGSTREAAILHKPFTPDGFARKVRTILDGRTDGVGA
jgi:PAS domain S-box-containing protein